LSFQGPYEERELSARSAVEEEMEPLEEEETGPEGESVANLSPGRRRLRPM